MATRTTVVGWRLRRAWLLLAIVAGVGLSCDGPGSEQHIGTAPASSLEHAIERTPVRSSALRSVGYDQEQQVLEIEFTNDFDTQAVSLYPLQIREAQSSLLSAQARLAVAETNLARCAVRALPSAPGWCADLVAVGGWAVVFVLAPRLVESESLAPIAHR